MSFLTVFFAVLLYVAAGVMVVGLALKIRQYWVTPSPLKIVATPAPLTPSGAAMRVAREVFFFESLFKSNKWTWILGVLFHAALLLVVLRHVRYFIEPVWGVIALIQPFGMYAGFAMAAGLAGLLARRLLVERVRYISGISDHLMLLLLLALAGSGLMMKYVVRTDIIAAKAFILGLMRFDWQPLPADPPLLVHLLLVAALMAVFPFSKLLHVPGIFFSPTRTQPDDAREKRHLAPWAAPLDAERDQHG